MPSYQTFSRLVLDYPHHTHFIDIIPVMGNIINELKLKDPDLKEAEIEGILYILLNSKSLTNNELVRLTGLPKETLKQFKFSIANFLKEAKDEAVSLNEDGIKIISDLKLKPSTLPLLKFHNPDLVKKLKEIRKKHNLIPKRELDQFFATEETSISKAEIVNAKGLIKNKSIAVLGDDDLASISIALLNPSYENIVVFDVDDEILKVVRDIAKEYDLKNVQTQVYSVFDILKIEFKHKFDVVLIDPPYTKRGVSLFLARSIQLLKKPLNFAGPFIFFNYGNSFKNPQKTLEIQELISSYKMVIEDKIDKFNSYYGAESIGSSSSVYVLKLTPATKVSDHKGLGKIYTYEKQEEDEFPFTSHYVFKLFDVPGKIIQDEKKLENITLDFCTKHNLKVKEVFVTKFKPHGCTITVVLSNSNLLIHTWYKERAVHIDLVVCTEIYKESEMILTLAQLFATEKIEYKKIE